MQILLDKHQQQGFFVLLLVLVQLISHTILNVVVDDEVELFFCKVVMLHQKQGLYDINCALLSAMKSKYKLNETRMRSKHGVNLVPLSPESSPFQIRLHGKLNSAEQSLLQSYNISLHIANVCFFLWLLEISKKHTFGEIKDKKLRYKTD